MAPMWVDRKGDPLAAWMAVRMETVEVEEKVGTSVFCWAASSVEGTAHPMVARWDIDEVAMRDNVSADWRAGLRAIVWAVQKVEKWGSG